MTNPSLQLVRFDTACLSARGAVYWKSLSSADRHEPVSLQDIQDIFVAHVGCGIS